MSRSAFDLVSRWSLPAARDVVWDAVDELLASDDPLAWWPSLRVDDYDGSVVRVQVRSAFGYRLRFTLTDLQASPPHALTFAATGDLRGRGRATFTDAGPRRCEVLIEWNVDTRRRWMRRTGWLLRPVFVAGHHLVMRQGRRHLTAWLHARESRGDQDIV